MKQEAEDDEMSMEIDSNQSDFPEAIRCLKIIQNYGFAHVPTIITKLMQIENEIESEYASRKIMSLKQTTIFASLNRLIKRN